MTQIEASLDNLTTIRMLSAVRVLNARHRPEFRACISLHMGTVPGWEQMGHLYYTQIHAKLEAD